MRKFSGNLPEVGRHNIGWTLFVLAVTACAVADTNSTTTTTTFTPTTEEIPEPTLVTSTGVATTTTSDDTGTTEDPSTSNSHPSDTLVLPDFGDDGPDCNGKIDILFAIDVGVDSEDTWQRMLSAFEQARPQFVEWFANFDTHWMVVTQFPHWGTLACVENCANNNGESCAPLIPGGYPCAAYTDGSLSECDATKGAGLTFPAGLSSTNKRCELAGEQRYIQSSEQPDLLAALECITNVGWTDGVGVHLEEAMVESISPTMAKVPSGCNYGFLRDDALLLVIWHSHYIGTDANPTGPKDWAASLYGAKGGDEDKVAVVGIVTDSTLPEPTVCEKEGWYEYASDVERFLHFDIKHAIHGSYCADDYFPFLKQGMELALALCGEQPPT